MKSAWESVENHGRKAFGQVLCHNVDARDHARPRRHERRPTGHTKIARLLYLGMTRARRFLVMATSEKNEFTERIVEAEAEAA